MHDIYKFWNILSKYNTDLYYNLHVNPLMTDDWHVHLMLKLF